MQEGRRLAQLSLIRRGVRNAAQSAEFYGWLLDVSPEQRGDAFIIPCANGELHIDDTATIPVSFALSHGPVAFSGEDPDRIPVTTTSPTPVREGVGPKLDHVRLNCGDLVAVTQFYRRLGLVVSGSGNAEGWIDGRQEEPVEEATWVHLSGRNGYLSLSQADWGDYGPQSMASGPPRFVHIGLAVADLDVIRERLRRRGVGFSGAPPDPIGDRLYLNDPDGDERGVNIELNEYVAGVPRSGLVDSLRSVPSS